MSGCAPPAQFGPRSSDPIRPRGPTPPATYPTLAVLREFAFQECRDTGPHAHVASMVTIDPRRINPLVNNLTYFSVLRRSVGFPR